MPDVLLAAIDALGQWVLLNADSEWFQVGWLQDCRCTFCASRHVPIWFSTVPLDPQVGAA